MCIPTRLRSPRSEMSTTPTRRLRLAILHGAAVLMMTTLAAAASAPARPNVLIVMPDDISHSHLSVFNARGPQTPNLDRLSRESVRLTDFHVSPTCSPTRAAL